MDRRRIFLGALIASAGMGLTVWAAGVDEKEAARSVAVKFWEALRDWDGKGYVACVDVSDEKVKETVQLHGRRMVVEMRIREVAAKTYGEEGKGLAVTSVGSNRGLFDLFIQATKDAPVEIDGNTARVVPVVKEEPRPGAPAGLVLDMTVVLNKVDGVWKVDQLKSTQLVSYVLSEEMKRVRLNRMVTESREAVAEEIAAGKHATAKDAARAFAEREAAGFEAMRKAKTRPATQVGTTRAGG